MMENLSPEQTKTLRDAQKKRSRVIMLLVLIWIAGLFALTLVKGHQAEDQRMHTIVPDQSSSKADESHGQ